jgi:hypothetical protein
LVKTITRQHAAIARPASPVSPDVKTSAPQVAPGSAPPAAAPSAAPGTGPRFYVMSGPRAGEEIALKHGFLIGKSPGCDLLIDDGYTSGHHAQIGMDHATVGCTTAARPTGRSSTACV